MDSTQFEDIIRDLAISKSDLAKLVGVTTRAVNLWSAGERAIPGPVIAYLRLLQSLPRALQVQELTRLSQENQMRYDGMYGVQYVGSEGQGDCVLVLMDGCVFGHDVGGALYDGTYEPNQLDPSKIDLHLTLTVPAGVPLVMGVPPQRAEYRFPIDVTVPARGTVQQEVATPFGQPVVCAIRFLRPIPARLAA